MMAHDYFILIIVLAYHGVESLNCVRQLSPCSCETDYQKVILDFKALDAGGTSRIKFKAVDTKDKTLRSIEYNPCSPIACNYGNSAAVCLSYSPSSELIIGLQVTARFIGTSDPSSIIIRY